MDDKEAFSWPQIRRFSFIEWKVFWDDRLIRSDIESMFNISTPQASVDLRNYREINPENLEIMPRGYRASKKFSPKFLIASADRLLLQMRAVLAGIYPGSEIGFRELPSCQSVPEIARSVPPAVLREVLSTMRSKEALNVKYHSLSGTRWRAIAPHALAFDGNRWHIRAFCCDKRDFRDFVISRIEEIGDRDNIEYDAANDLEWNAIIPLVLRPKAGLSAAQSRAIQLDYGMSRGRKIVNVRLALAFYFIRRYNLDLSIDEIIGPERIQIELENHDEVIQAIKEMRDRSRLLINSYR